MDYINRLDNYDGVDAVDDDEDDDGGVDDSHDYENEYDEDYVVEVNDDVDG